MTSLDETMTLAHGSPWRNRVALAPMTNRQSRDDGVLSDDERAWLVRRAEGGFGLVMTCAAHVTANGQGWPGAMGISEDAHLEGLARLADELRAAGAVSSVQLHHGGRRADPVVVPERVAPWDDERHGARALLTSEIEALVEAVTGEFLRVAGRAEFDRCVVHPLNAGEVFSAVAGTDLRQSGVESPAMRRRRSGDLGLNLFRLLRIAARFRPLHERPTADVLCNRDWGRPIELARDSQ